MIMPINRKNVTEQVLNQILGNIVAGEWLPGNKLPSENDLAQMFSTSRVPIREALQKLAALGIVQTRQGQGTFVCTPSPQMYYNSLLPIMVLNRKSMLDILFYRAIVEPECAALAALHADEADLSRMKITLEDIIRIHQPVIEFSKADLEFHLEVARASKNMLFMGIAIVVRNFLISYYKKINEIMGIERAVHYHSLVYDAIRGRDADTARRYMKEHIQTTIDDVSNKYFD
jgi:GntR family transcriptional repressor for pyruvate dehydrogenase complex